MEYLVKKTTVAHPGLDSAEWDLAELGIIRQSRWEGYFPCPETTFKILYSDQGLSLLFHTAERHLRSEGKTYLDPICEDSCVEFFYKPNPYDKRYLNFEVNPDGVMHIGIGTDRYDRELIPDDRSILNIESDAQEGNWTITYDLPYSFLKKFFDDIAPVGRMNAYKCGSRTDHRHSGCWAPVETAKPDFHVPDFFDKIRFE